MTSAKALIGGLILALILAALAPILGGNGGAGYSEVALPFPLFVASVLSLRVSTMYKAGMRRMFQSLSVFLLLFGLITVTPVIDAASDALDDNFLKALLAYQVFTYSFLLVAMFIAARISGVGRINRAGQLILALVVALGIVIVSRSFTTFSDIAESSDEAAAIYLVVRILDVVVMVLVAPVLILFVQNARAKRQESLTFTVIGASIIASLVLVYLYELFSGDSLAEIVFRDHRQGSLLDGLYIFGYTALVVGIFAHWKHQEWSIRAVERVLGLSDGAIRR